MLTAYLISGGRLMEGLHWIMALLLVAGAVLLAKIVSNYIPSLFGTQYAL
jgi:hypothetical protein